MAVKQILLFAQARGPENPGVRTKLNINCSDRSDISLALERLTSCYKDTKDGNFKGNFEAIDTGCL